MYENRIESMNELYIEGMKLCASGRSDPVRLTKWLNRTDTLCNSLIADTSLERAPLAGPAKRLSEACDERDTKSAVRLLKNMIDIAGTIEKVLSSRVDAPMSDIFISHASGDQRDYVDPLYEILKNRLKLEVYYYKYRSSSEFGEKLQSELWREALRARFGLIVFSKHFFESPATEFELRVFLARQRLSSSTIILPVLYGVSWDEVLKRYSDCFIEDIYDEEPLYFDANGDADANADIVNQTAFEVAAKLIGAYRK